MDKQLQLFCTLEEAEAMAEKSALEARDKAVRLLQYGVREGDVRPMRPELEHRVDSS